MDGTDPSPIHHEGDADGVQVETVNEYTDSRTVNELVCVALASC